MAWYGIAMRRPWTTLLATRAGKCRSASAPRLYLNVFVGVVQSFLKVPALRALAPKQTEPPFVISQLAVLLLFVVLSIVAAIRFRSEGMGGGGTRPAGR